MCVCVCVCVCVSGESDKRAAKICTLEGGLFTRSLFEAKPSGENQVQCLVTHCRVGEIMHAHTHTHTPGTF